MNGHKQESGLFPSGIRPLAAGAASVLFAVVVPLGAARLVHAVIGTGAVGGAFWLTLWVLAFVALGYWYRRESIFFLVAGTLAGVIVVLGLITYTGVADPLNVDPEDAPIFVGLLLVPVPALLAFGGAALSARRERRRADGRPKDAPGA